MVGGPPGGPLVLQYQQPRALPLPPRLFRRIEAPAHKSPQFTRIVHDFGRFRLDQAGFDVVELRSEVLRMEMNEAVVGLLVVARVSDGSHDAGCVTAS